MQSTGKRLQLAGQWTLVFAFFFFSASAWAQLQIDTVIATPVTCHGFENGTAEVFVSGGTPPYSITWSDGQEGPLATNLAPGSYTVGVVDSLGAAVSASATIDEPSPILIQSTGITYPECPDDTTGIISIDATGGVMPYSIYWNNNQTGPVLNNAIAGTYFVFVLDALGCLESQQYELPNVDTIAPVVIASPAFLTLDENGEAPLSPQIMDVQSSDNCALGGINIDPPVMTCNNLGANVVTVSVVDLNGNSASVQVTVTVVDDEAPILPSQTLNAQLGPDGTVTIDPADLATMATDNCTIGFWEASQTTFTCDEVGMNEVQVTVTDLSGNSVSVQSFVFVEDVLPPVVLTKDITVSLNASGLANIAADQVDDGSSDNCGFISKQVTPSQFSCDDLTGGPVEVTLKITDLHGNVATETALVTVVDAIAPAITCPADITIDFCDAVQFDMPTASDNCSFQMVQTEGLSNGAFFPFGVTTQTFEATDTYGNLSACSFTVTVENDFLIETEIQAASCPDSNDGSIEISISGGTPPYALFWSAGGNTNLPAGAYSVTIYDLNGCESIQAFEIPGPDPFEAEIVNVQAASIGQPDGGFTLILTGGTPPYSFEGTTFNDTLEVSGYPAGTFTIPFTDQNGCQTSVVVTIPNISSVGEPQILKQFAVSPNPATDFAVARIRLNQPASMQLSLVGLDGRTLHTWSPVNAQSHTFDLQLGDLPGGIYTLMLRVDGEIAVRKFVVF